jgi:hypothetical protein
MPSLAREFNISLSTVHDYIEEQRKLLRAQTIDLAAQERDQALELLDNAIEKVVPHINGQVTIETIIERGEKPPITMTVEEWQARMKGCQVLVQLLDRKAKLLGVDVSVKVEPPPVVVPETEEQRARAREALKTWCKFALNPTDFQGHRGGEVNTEDALRRSGERLQLHDQTRKTMIALKIRTF